MSSSYDTRDKVSDFAALICKAGDGIFAEETVRERSVDASACGGDVATRNFRLGGQPTGTQKRDSNRSALAAVLQSSIFISFAIQGVEVTLNVCISVTRFMSVEGVKMLSSGCIADKSTTSPDAIIVLPSTD